MLPEPYMALQRTIREANRNYARSLTWCRDPQNNSQRLRSHFKPRISILVRPPIVKTGLERRLNAGSGEIIFHVPGTFSDSRFVVDSVTGSKCRIVVGDKSPYGLIELIDDKLSLYEPQIASDFLSQQYDGVVVAFYSVVRESIICQRAYYS
ncbi:MAG TPA: hypothetical protein VK158_01505 [Acidobacteriota bacterium]|nr:hypothetical protein [Acidobacteriota bacterium]